MLLTQLNKVEKIATGSKLSRFAVNPLRYAKAIGFRHFLYPYQKKGLQVRAQTFWEEPFWVELPAGTDIYLTGGKADESEIRLARFLIKTLKPGDTFIDIGSHFGYFSRLAMRIVQEQGRIIAIEPSKKTFALLQKNLAGYTTATALNCLIGAENTTKEFFEFPTTFSEYNTVYPEQFKQSDWYQNAAITRYPMACKTLDSLVDDYKISPKLIKIDTEGSELEVMKGARKMLLENREVALIMEYLSKARHNEPHVQASGYLETFGFRPYMIAPDGTLMKCKDVEQHLANTNKESDNIVYKYTA